MKRMLGRCGLGGKEKYRRERGESNGGKPLEFVTSWSYIFYYNETVPQLKSLALHQRHKSIRLELVTTNEQSRTINLRQMERGNIRDWHDVCSWNHPHPTDRYHELPRNNEVSVKYIHISSESIIHRNFLRKVHSLNPIGSKIRISCDLTTCKTHRWLKFDIEHQRLFWQYCGWITT